MFLFMRSVVRRPYYVGQEMSFAYSAPSIWNYIPQQVRSSDSVSTFRSRAKTHIFRLAIDFLDFAVVIIVLFIPLSAVLMDEWLLCQCFKCFVTVTIFFNNVFL